MTRWDVDVPAAGQVISQAGRQGAAYEGDLAAVNATFERAAAALSRSPLVVGRLGEFAQVAATPHLEAVVGHTHSALQGASDAVAAYVAGDLAMAANAQGAAGSAVYPGSLPGSPSGAGVPR
ncbi:MAG: DUF6507 family protein [Phycicoccus sp.]